MIAICIACGLLICLFRLDLDDAASQVSPATKRRRQMAW